MSDSRRFYFDDGKSRKRWRVQTKGKSQIVQYGRLGGSLRESKKSFKSPAEAKDAAEKLIAKKKREGYIEIDPSRLEITRLKGKRRATEKQIKVLENQIGCDLPDEYRNFLKTHNGGRPNPDCVDVPGMEGIDKVGVGVLFHLQPAKPGIDELSYEIERCGKLLPHGRLPIAGSSDLFTLSLKPETFGSVYWWFHETVELDDDGNFLESAGYLLAGSFEEFLTRIALVFGDAAESEAAPAAPSGGAKKKPKAAIRRLLALVQHDHTPQKVKEIEQVVQELGDLSGIQDGEWPFQNIRSPRIVRCLLEAGLNPEITDTDQHSLLWQCAGNRECVDLLLQRGVKVDRRSGGDFETALMRAIYLEDIPAVQRLLEAGANPTLRLDWPMKHKLESNEKLRKLIEKARAEWRKNKGKKAQQATAKPKSATPEKKKKGPKPTIKRLLRLMKHDYIPEEFEEMEEIEELIAELGDLSGIRDGEWPKIHRFECPRLLGRLLEAGLNPEITDKEGNSLLGQCVLNSECIDLLLDRGVDIDRRSGKHDETALMRAVRMGDEDDVEYLLNAGANPTLEFSSVAKIFLNMDEKTTALLEAARADWSRNKGKEENGKEGYGEEKEEVRAAAAPEKRGGKKSLARGLTRRTRHVYLCTCSCGSRLWRRRNDPIRSSILSAGCSLPMLEAKQARNGANRADLYQWGVCALLRTPPIGRVSRGEIRPRIRRPTPWAAKGAPYESRASLDTVSRACRRILVPVRRLVSWFLAARCSLHFFVINFSVLTTWHFVVGSETAPRNLDGSMIGMIFDRIIDDKKMGKAREAPLAPANSSSLAPIRAD